MSKRLPAGQLVKVCLDGLCYSEAGFALGGSISCEGMKIFETISLSAFPSCNDFLGKSTLIRSGDVGVVTRYVGRPFKVNRNPKWFNYDIYEILINDSQRQIFRQNIKPISRSKKKTLL